ncbi:MAG TPA: hypothetical protein VE377_20385 [Candidatus Dormibacteraeota bacterium]|nr:hypothetical protein [Candidatus Dormibacteraeota bacterium]
MRRQTLILALLYLGAVQSSLYAQDFKVFNRVVQVHGFASQGFLYTDQNNWLTTHSSQGSAAFTDFGANVSMQITDKFRVGVQVYDRNLGDLGEWHPSIDWAFADYRWKSWFGVRGGKVKTVLGLHNNTQDLDFLHTFALLPQSIYPTDLRDATMAHLGGDVYGNISLKHGLGDLSYTGYVGRRRDSSHSGYAYFVMKYGVNNSDLTALQYGGDLRWKTPLRGLLIGASRLNQQLTDTGTVTLAPLGTIPFSAVSKSDWTNQFYGQYAAGRVRLESEYRRFVHDQTVLNGMLTTVSDVRGWYVAGSLRVTKPLEVGSYYSRYSITSVVGGPLSFLAGSLFPQQTDTSLPANHIYDKALTARIDLNRFWNVKVEGHFMDGYGLSSYPMGFYPQVNPQGFKPNTNALVLKTSVNF